MPASLADRLKIQAVVRTRYLNSAAIQRWSRSCFRRTGPPAADPPTLVASRDHYATPGLPAGLRVPAEIPPCARLGLRYTLPYYYLTGALFKLLRRVPLDPSTAWSPDETFNRAFPDNREGWTDTLGDAAFARLRVQGPNPFLLTATGPGAFEVDYGPYFDGIHAPVRCGFALQAGVLQPTAIHLDTTVVRPGDPGWTRAKLVANALDARYCVFTRHLLETHLVVGQAFALSAFVLPHAHPLRAFLDFFTFGTLVVNDFAYKLLITPASYFLQANFIGADDALRLFDNSLARFELDSFVLPRDVQRRGLDAIPDHPYVQDGREAWAILHDFVTGWLDRAWLDDGALRRDAEAQRWHAALVALLPGQAGLALDDRERLAELLTCLLYNNVVHEVCGDFSCFSSTADPEHLQLVNFERLKRGELDAPPSAADVFLLSQGAFAGTFNNGGNNLMSIDVDRWLSDPLLREAVRGLQARLRDHDARLVERNQRRAVPFSRMMPRQWEASISF